MKLIRELRAEIERLKAMIQNSTEKVLIFDVLLFIEVFWSKRVSDRMNCVVAVFLQKIQANQRTAD